MCHINIKFAEDNDIYHLSAVERSAAQAFHVLKDYESSDRTVSPEQLLAMQATNLLWVAQNAQQLVGFIGCRGMGALLYIHEVSVAYDYQQQGIGRQLMQTAIHAAEEQGYTAVGLTTRRDAPWNMPFYQSLGFTELPHHNAYPQLTAQLAREIIEGADPAIRCAMVQELK